MKLCVNTSLHTAFSVPESFAGAAVSFAEAEYKLNASTWSYEPIFEDSINKGGPGVTMLLTSGLTLVNGEDSIKVQ